MKKNIFILSLTILLVSFLFAIEIIDNFSASRLFVARAADDKGLDRVGVVIENTENLFKISNKDFYNRVNDIAVENHLMVYVAKQYIDDDGQVESVVYLSSNDDFLKDRLLIESGYASEIIEGVTYSTYSEKKSNRILSFMSTIALSVQPLNQFNEKGKYINLINLEGDIRENVVKFMNELADEYGDLILKSPYTSPKETTASADKEALKGIFDHLQVKFAVALVLIVMMCSKIFSCTRKISIMKIEGNRPFEIYRSLFLRDFLTFQIIVFTLFITIVYLLYGTNLMTFMTVSIITLVELLQMLTFSLCISLFVYLIIRYTPIMASIKGQNSLDEVQRLAYFVKFLAVFLILPLLSNTLLSVKNYVIMTSRHDRVFHSLENQYSFGTQGSSEKYQEDMGTKNYVALRNELARDGNLFEQVKAFFMTENFADFDPENKDEYYSVDKFYLEKEDLIHGCNLEDICIFIRNDRDLDLNELKTKVRRLTRDPLPIHINYVNQNFLSYNFSDLLYQNEISDLPIIYIPKEDRFEGQLNDTILLFDGSLEEAQEYVDSIFIKYGYAPFYKLDSQQSSYQRLYQAYRSFYTKNLIQFIVMIIAYIFANRLLIEVDIDNNRKRYQLASFEGINPYQFKIYTLKIVSPAILAVLGCILLKQVVMDSSFLEIVGFICCVEGALYVLFNYKYSNIRRFK